MGRTATVALLLLLTGCGATAPKPVVVPEPLPFRLETIPKLMLSYSEFWLVCTLPADVGEGSYAMGIPGVSVSAGPIESIRKQRLMRAGCDPIQAFCSYAEYKDGKKHTITLDITPQGECK